MFHFNYAHVCVYVMKKLVYTQTEFIWRETELKPHSLYGMNVQYKWSRMASRS